MAYCTDSNINRVPSNAVRLGNQFDSGEYYLAMTFSKIGLLPGKAKVGEAWYSYDGAEYHTKNFFWITIPPGYEVGLVKSPKPPTGALKTGYEDDKLDLYAAVAHTGHGDIPGKALERGDAYYPYGGREGNATSFSWVVLRKSM